MVGASRARRVHIARPPTPEESIPDYEHAKEPLLKSRRVAVLSVVLIVAATAGPADSGGGGSGLCILCGDRGLADFILNVGLYAPLGAALAATGWGGIRTTGAGALLSLSIEVLQLLVIPGRDASLGDLTSNMFGAALGWLAWRAWIRQQQAGPRVATVIPGIAALLATATLTGGLWLLTPSFPRALYYLQWTPELRGMEVYQGRVLSSRIGFLDLQGPPGPIQRTDSIRLLLRRGATAEAIVRIGPPPSGLAPIFSIYDEHQREIMLLGADDQDLVYRWRTMSDRFRLDRAEIRFTGLLGAVEPGDTVALAVAPSESAAPGARGYCARAGQAVTCHPGLTADQTWTLLFYGEGWKARSRRLLGLLWLGAIFFPAGFLGRRWRDRLLAAIVAVPGLTALPVLLGFSATPSRAVLAAVAGIGLGGLVSPLKPHGFTLTSSARPGPVST